MPHLTVSGTQSPALHCDPRRIAGGVPDHVTPIFRTSPGLLAGRYLHTMSAKSGGVSIALVGNGSQASLSSKAPSYVERMAAGPERSDHRSGCSAADLTVPEGNLAARGRVATRRPNEGMRELPATNGAERCAISMARPASGDIGVAEVHDSITGAVPISYEDDGFPESTAVSALTILEGPIADGS
jgi:hypothetical protein